MAFKDVTSVDSAPGQTVRRGVDGESQENRSGIARMLAEQRERFTFATTAAQLGYWFCDLPFDELIWDVCVKEHFWLPEDAKVSIDLFYQRIHPGDRQRTRLAIEASIANRTRYDVEYRTVSPEGKQRWIRAIGRTAYSIDGTPIRFDGVTQDITLLKQTMAELAESRERLRLFVENAPAAIAMFDCEMRYLAASRRWREDCSLRDDPAGKSHYDLFPNLPEHWLTAHRSALAGETLKMEQECFVRRDGSIQWIRWELFPWHTADGAVGGILLATEDITEKVLAAEALDTERRRLSTLFENAPIGLIFADANGRILSGNRQAEQILGHPILLSQDGVGDREWIGHHPDGRRVERHEWPLAQVLMSRQTHRGEYRYQRGNGDLAWIEVTGAPICDTEGKLIGLVAALMDIDARKRAEQALMQSEKLALVGRLAATISHEINNPLESITNLLYLIQESASSPVAREYTRTAQEELARVSQMVTHTLRFNRQSQQASLERMSDLMQTAAAIYEARIRSSGVNVVQRFDAEDRVYCMGSELRQVFANLIGNAFDATRAGGSIFLRTARQRHSSTGAGGVRVTVADTGTGMDSETQKHLFDAFFTTKGDHGTGLGLWISANILATHHAGIRMRSRQTRGRSGTIFSIWLPEKAITP